MRTLLAALLAALPCSLLAPDSLACTSPGSFQLTSPNDGASALWPEPELQWEFASGADHYKVYWDTSEYPPFLNSSEVWDTRYTPIGLSEDTTYYWYVEAIPAGCGGEPVTSNFDGVRSFTTGSVCPLPAAFSLTYPSNGAVEVATDAPLEWEAAAGAERYKVYWGLNDPPSSSSEVWDGTQFYPSNLSQNQTYYWYVEAFPPACSIPTKTNTGGVHSFTTACDSPPGAFGLSSPSDGEMCLSNRPTLTWQPSSGASNYEVYLDQTNPPSTSYDVTSTSFTPSFDLSGGVYYWTVKANLSGCAVDATDGVRQFEVGGSCCSNPDPPVPSSPSNGETEVSTSACLQWSPPSGWNPGVDYFIVHLGTTNPPPASNDTIVDSNTKLCPGPLTGNTTYFWSVEHVLGCDTNRRSTSETRSFTTAAGSCNQPGTFTLSSPGNGAVNVPVNPTLSWTASEFAQGYWVNFGTSSPPPLHVAWSDGESFDVAQQLGTLQNDTTYYWSVDAVGSCETITPNTGGTRSFATLAHTCDPPGAFDLISPSAGRTGVSVNPTFSWGSASGAGSYIIGLGKQNPTEMTWSVTGTSFSPSAVGVVLAPDTQYVWTIEAVASCDETKRTTNRNGPRSFTTLPDCSPPGAFDLISPSAGRTGVSVNPTFSWGSASGAGSYIIGLGKQNPTEMTWSVTGTSFSPSAVGVVLAPDTQYVWTVEAVASCDETKRTTNRNGPRGFTTETATETSLTLSPASLSVERGRSAELVVTLSSSALFATPLTVTSSAPEIVLAPERVTIESGSTSTRVPLTGLSVGGPVRITASLPSGSGGSSASSNVTVIGTPARVLVSTLPSPMIQYVEDGRSTSTRFAITNQGDVPTTVTLSAEYPVGTSPFFNLSPSSFELAGAQSQFVTVETPAQPLGTHVGFVGLSGTGVLSESRKVPVKLLVTGTPGTEIPDVMVVESRVDVSGKENVNPRGVVRFRNDGNGAAEGVVAVDVSWIIPEQDSLTIQPGQTAEVDFTVDRSLRPDAGALTGSVSGQISFVYPIIVQTGRVATDATPSLATPSATVVDTVTPDAPLSGIPLLRPGETGFVLGGVGNVTGSVGTFVSDIAIANAFGSTTISDLKLYYLQEGADRALVAPQSAAGGQSISLADAVATIFGGSQQLGTIHLRSLDALKLRIGANVFNKTPSEGSYGTAIPSFLTDRGATAGSSLRISGIRKSETSHTNLYIQELIGYPATVDLTFYDKTGAPVGFEAGMEVPPFGLLRLLQERVPDGAMSALLQVSGKGSIASFVTPVDRTSGDTWAVTDWNRYFGVPGNQRSVIPVVGALNGANGTYFRTDISLANADNRSGAVTLRYHQQSPTVQNVDRSVPLDPNAAVEIEDAAVAFFGADAPTVGWVDVIPGPGMTPSVSSRTYTTVAGTTKTFGTGVPVIPADQAMRVGESRVIGGLRSATRETIQNATGNTFRTNVGLVEIAGRTVKVRVSVLYPDGRQLSAGGAKAFRDYSLSPHQWMQINTVVAAILGETARSTLPHLDNVQVRFDVLEGDGSVIPYATTTDNGTGDTVFRIE